MSEKLHTGIELPEEEMDVAEDVVDEGTSSFVKYRFVADPGQTLLRIDKFLVDRITHVSRNRIQDAADAGMILANGVSVKSNYRVKPLDEIEVLVSTPPQSTEIIPEEMSLDIVYEDDVVMVVNKPAGMVVHPGHGNFFGTLVNGLAWHFRNQNNFPTDDPRPGLVHRIDKNTSGLLVVAKNPEAKAHLGWQFFHKTTERKYIALVWGNFDEDTGTVTGAIGRNPKDRQRMAVVPEEKGGKPAVTHYRVLERFGYVSLVECQLETGRTHQIRVHMMHIGHPLFNDPSYGGDQILRGTTFAKYAQFIRNCFEVCPRHALHAMTLGFEHPVSGEFLRFNSELPNDMEQLIDRWRNYVSSREIQTNE
ncbi:MAG: RluA family pseudouridine synthase [Bacteroidales bacterium]|jgi:23S rRNA pseudouridine1911/1915/1917 synthase|nr:RluA family pseudouridine synthase [Bacteroidales bacterium]